MPPLGKKHKRESCSPPSTPPPLAGSSIKGEATSPKSPGASAAWAAEEDGAIIEEILKQFKPNWPALQQSVNARGGRERTFKAIRMRWEKSLRKRIAALGGL